MNHWPFIIAAYGATLIGTIVLVIVSYRSMRSAERQAEELRRPR